MKNTTTQTISFPRTSCNMVILVEEECRYCLHIELEKNFQTRRGKFVWPIITTVFPKTKRVSRKGAWSSYPFT